MLQSRRTQTCREGVLETRGWDIESEWITQLLRATTSLVGCLVSLPLEWEGWMYWMTWGLSLGEFWIILHAVSRIFTVNLMFCVVSVSGLLCSLSALSNLVQRNRNPALFAENHVQINPQTLCSRSDGNKHHLKPGVFVGSELTMRTAHRGQCTYFSSWHLQCTQEDPCSLSEYSLFTFNNI